MGLAAGAVAAGDAGLVAGAIGGVRMVGDVVAFVFIVVVPVAFGIWLMWYVWPPRMERRQTKPQPLTWAQQRNADRREWLGVQQQAMREWEDACNCPERRTFDEDLTAWRDHWTVRELPVLDVLPRALSMGELPDAVYWQHRGMGGMAWWGSQQPNELMPPMPESHSMPANAPMPPAYEMGRMMSKKRCHSRYPAWDRMHC